MDNRKLTAKILVEEFGWDFFSRRSIKDPTYIRKNTQHKHGSELLFDINAKVFYERKDPTKRYKYPYCIEVVSINKSDLSFNLDKNGNPITELYLDGELTDMSVEDYINKYIL